MRAYLNLGSNVDRETHLCFALDELLAEFGTITVSSVYESAAVGFDGAPFLNLAVGIDCERPVDELVAWLRGVEDRGGRDRSQPRFSDRTLDIDLLTYGDLQGDCGGVQLPRPEIGRQPFVLGPLAEIAPELRLADDGRPLATRWQALAPGGLGVVAFAWQGLDLSAEPGPKQCSAG